VPKSAYGQSKLNIENYLRFYARTTRLDVKILRISNPYGAGQNPYGVQGLVAVAMGCALHDRTLKIFGKGDAVRDYIHIDDVISAMTKVAERPGSVVLNISSGKGLSVLEMVSEIEAVIGHPIKKEHIAPRYGDVNVSVLSSDLARGLYPWSPQVEIQEGLAKTWAWISGQK
jgi:UDP-glucose 4-epimerase